MKKCNFLFLCAAICCSSMFISCDTFGAKSTLKDSRDDKSYKITEIGGKVWMAENLNYKTDESYCYDDAETNCQKYGRLYSSNAAKAACPKDWHLPTQEEFDLLFISVGTPIHRVENKEADKLFNRNEHWLDFSRLIAENAGLVLKSKLWDNNSTDNYGFSVLPGGDGNRSSRYYGKDSYASFWAVVNEKRMIRVNFAGKNAEYKTAYDDDAYSVRCVKD